VGVQIGGNIVSLTQLQEIPSENMILLVGPPGSGKSTFCQQAILKGLAIDKPIIYVTTERGPSKAEIALKERGLAHIEPGLLSFVDAYNETVGVSVSDRPDTVYADCNDLSSIDIAISKLSERIGRKNILLVFDSLTSPYLFSGAEILRFMRQTLSRFATRGNAVVACIDEGCGKEEDLVAMMSISDGVIRTEREESKLLLNVVKHPKVSPTRIEIHIEPERRLEYPLSIIDENGARRFIKAYTGGKEAAIRREVGDYVNLFWTNLIHWSGMLWDPKRFPTMKYELEKEDMSRGYQMFKYYPWYSKLLFSLLFPKNISKPEDMKKYLGFYGKRGIGEMDRTGIVEYLEDVSKTDEYYVRVYENSDCWGFENVGAKLALYLPPNIAGGLMSMDMWGRGTVRDWNAVETKCVGLGDPYCEFKIVPGEIDGLKDSLEKDIPVLERVHDRLMQRLTGFLLEGKPLVERPRLGSDVHLAAATHVVGWLSHADERYEMALRMGGAKAGKEVGEHLMKAGISEDEAVKRVLHLLEHCKVGKVAVDETIKIKENFEMLIWTMFVTAKSEEPLCFFTTGFLNGFFSAVKNQHVKETKCIAMGDPYCEWEFR
jgi:predicted hydrocarbon binding protein/KaiC/GvpD/RAD55 family RecA-like ATPase